MGARLGRYVVLKHIASGGMADVLLGRTDGIEGFERHVVLKRIRPEHARDQRFIRMFLDEARVAANLHHQHIVQVHDIGEAGGEYFIAMEYIHGEDVRTILSTASKTRAHVPLGYAVAIVSAAAAGLHYAHEKRGSDKRPLGIVHRDVSPSNILVGYDGSIKIVDFGIAKATMRQETRSGSLKGKVSYMSPEQCKSDDIDRRSDVYSLGVVLYELATTTRLFKGENDYLVMDQIVNGRVSLPRVRRPDLPNELSTIIMRALAPDPERRYFTADELRVALDQFANKAGLTASTSAIAAYMRKQFGERPEPWLELGNQAVTSLDEGRTPVGELPRSSWTELPRSEDSIRRSGPVLRASGPISTVGEVTADAAASQDAMPRTPVVRLPSTPPPTDSKMGWESQQPAPAPRGATPAKVAMICAPLILILGVAIWRLAGTGSTTSPAAAVATRTVTPPAPAPGPVVTPIPEAPKPGPDVAVGSATPAPAGPAGKTAAAVRSPDPTQKRAPAPASAKKTAAAKIVEATTPSPAKPEAPAAVPASTTPPIAAATPPAGATTPPAAVPAPAAVPPPVVVTPPVAAPPVAAPPAPTPAVVTPPAAPAEPAIPQLSHAVVDRVASDHSRDLSKCDGGEELHGEITVKFAVDASGKVTKAQVATGLKKPKVSGCILRLVQGWHFPKQGPGGAQGTYTISFQ
jgi:serine/threonine protein kinase